MKSLELGRSLYAHVIGLKDQDWGPRQRLRDQESDLGKMLVYLACVEETRGVVYVRGRCIYVGPTGRPPHSEQQPIFLLNNVEDKQDILRRAETHLPHLPEMRFPAASAFSMPMGFYPVVQEISGS